MTHSFVYCNYALCTRCLCYNGQEIFRELQNINSESFGSDNDFGSEWELLHSVNNTSDNRNHVTL